MTVLVLQVCTLHNKTAAARCRACDTARDGDLAAAEEILAPSRPGHWVCHVCTFENSPKRVVCQVAAVARGPVVLQKVPSEGS